MKKKWLSLLLAFCMVLSLFPFGVMAADVVDSGTCGENVTWTLDSDGLLTISGSGAMSNDGSDGPLYNNEAICTVVIEEGVTGVGNYAFGNCTNLTSVTLPDGLESIGNQAFARCSCLRDINIPSSVTSIGISAFESCGRLTSVTIPEGVTSIESESFSGCGLTSVTIPDGVTTIGSGAFRNNARMTEITIPSSVTTIGNWAFSNCTALTDVYYDGTEAQWNEISIGSTEDGNAPLLNADIQFSEPQDPTFVDGGQCGDNVTWTLDADGVLTVTGIGRMNSPDIQNRDAVIEIVIESGVENVASYAFEGCSNLTTVTIPASVQRTEYEDGYEYGAFLSCPNLTDIYYGGTAEAFSAFGRGHEEMNTALIHASDMSFYASGSCGDDLRWIVDENGVLTISGAGEMWDWPSFEVGDLIQTIQINDGVTSIGSNMCDNCPNVQTISIPESVTGAGYGPFNAESITAISYAGTVEQFAHFEIAADTMHNAVVTASDATFLQAGSCGDNAIWILDEDYGVTIRGTGYMWGMTLFQGSEEVRSVTVENGLEDISGLLFSGCSNLETVTIAASVTAVESGAFGDCSSLKDVYFDWTRAEFAERYVAEDALSNAALHFRDGDFLSVGRCGEDMRYTLDADGTLTLFGTGEMWDTDIFQSNGDILSLVVGENVTRISDNAFSGCGNLSSVSFPSTLAVIGDSAFNQCASLKRVDLPLRVNTIGYSAFGSDELDDVYYAGTTLQFVSFAQTYSFANDTMIHTLDGAFSIWGTCGDTAYFTLNDGHAHVYGEGEVREGSLGGNDWLHSIEFEEGITSIGTNAFDGAVGLRSVALPDSLGSIADSAFYMCSALTDITFSDRLESIGNWAFYGCSSLIELELPAGLKSIGGAAFAECTGLTSVTIPQGVTSIDYTAFDSCTALQDVYFDGDYDDFSHLDLMNTFPNATLHFRDVVYHGIGRCGDDVLYTLDADGTLTISGTGEMWNWSRGDSPFHGDERITSVVIGSGVTSIGLSAFEECANLTDVSVPLSVERVFYQFYDDGLCTPFDGCTSLADVYFAGRVADFAALDMAKDPFPGAELHFTDGDYLLFGMCGDNLIFTEDLDGVVTVSGSGDMWRYANHSDDYASNSPLMSNASVRAVVLESGVTSIGRYAFADCENLASVTIPSSVVEIVCEHEDEQVFSPFVDCTALKDVYFGGTTAEFIRLNTPAALLNNAAIHTADGDFTLTEPYGVCGDDLYWTVDGTTLTIYGTGDMWECGWYESLFEPAEYQKIRSVVIEQGVTSIGSNAFHDFEYLMNLTIPASVKRIGGDAFSNCGRLTSVYITDLAAWCGIAFGSNPLLTASRLYVGGELVTDLVIPEGVTAISGNAFEGFASITSVTIPEGVERIGQCAFNQCTGVTSVSLPESLKTIGNSAFNGCAALESLAIPSGVETIGESSFAGCVSMASLTMAEGLKTIDGYAFSNCDALKELTFPVSVEEIGDYAFESCDGLKIVSFPGADVLLGNNVFYVCYDLRDVLYAGTQAQWEDSGNRFCGLGDDVRLHCSVTDFENHIRASVVEPTCGDEGYTARECSCGYEFELVNFVDALGHETERQGVAEPTCTEPGYTGDDVCVRCGETVAWGWETDPLGHDWGEWTVIQEATPAQLCVEKHVCGRCGLEETRNVPVPIDVILGDNMVYVADSEELLCTFVPEQDGVYRFLGTMPDADTCVALYDAAGNMIGCDDDSSENYQFCLDAELTAGETYGVGLHFYHFGVEGAITFRVTPKPPEIWSQTGNVVCSTEDTGKFEVGATGTDLTYQWQYRTSEDGLWNDCTEATQGYNTPTLMVAGMSGGTNRNGYEYRCIVTDAFGQTAVSEPATFQVFLPVVIESEPEDAAAAPGDTVCFTVGATGDDLTYQWQYKTPTGTKWNNSTLSSATTPTLTFKASASYDGRLYRCVISNRVTEKTSDTAMLTIVSAPLITAQPQSVSANVGDMVQFTVGAEGSDLSFQWQYQKAGSSTWYSSGSSGNKTATLTVEATTARNGMQFRCLVTNAGGTTISEAATLSVAAKPMIAASPQSVTANAGETVQFTVQATGADLTYQWQYRKAGSSSWYSSGSPGSKTATLSVEATSARDGMQFRCKVTNAAGSVLSEAAMLTVLSAPVITTQPVSKTASVGDTVKFTVKATGVDLTYQWQYRKAGTSTWYSSGSTGNKTATLTISATAARHGMQFRCVVKNDFGKVTSSAATLSVPSAPVITTQPVSKTANVGDTVKFTVKATGNDLTYQWQYKTATGTKWNDSTSSSAKKATFSVKASASYHGRQYRCIITNDLGTVTTEAVTLTVPSAPSITTQPTSKTAAVGDTVKFTVKATGSDLTYQWQYCKTGSSTWYNSTSTGNKTATLKISATAARNGMQFRCVITNDLGTVTSKAVTLTVQ